MNVCVLVCACWCLLVRLNPTANTKRSLTSSKNKNEHNVQHKCIVQVSVVVCKKTPKQTIPNNIQTTTQTRAPTTTYKLTNFCYDCTLNTFILSVTIIMFCICKHNFNFDSGSRRGETFPSRFKLIEKFETVNVKNFLLTFDTPTHHGKSQIKHVVDLKVRKRKKRNRHTHFRKHTKHNVSILLE